MKCTDCRYCICQDYGYSNYTVEGTTADCLLHLNPELPHDRFYGETPHLEFAEKCEKFSEGTCVDVDCDQESGPLEVYSEDEEIKELLREF